jgi:hypothetical protein
MPWATVKRNARPPRSRPEGPSGAAQAVGERDPTGSAGDASPRVSGRLTPMLWTTRNVDEVKMDGEVGSYEEDFDPPRDAPVVGERDQHADG